MDMMTRAFIKGVKINLGNMAKGLKDKNAIKSATAVGIGTFIGTRKPIEGVFTGVGAYLAIATYKTMNQIDNNLDEIYEEMLREMIEED